MSKFEDLDVWKLSHELVLDVYRITKSFPKEERFRLIDQFCRAACSIPANICEGTGRNTRKDFIHFLHIARGSLQEVKYYIILVKDLGYINETDKNNLLQKCYQIGRMLNSLINKLEEN